MESDSGTILMDSYFGLLSSLSRENKIRLIARLSNSIVDEPEVNENVVDKFFGAFKSSKSVDEIIKEIKESRTFDRVIETF